ncbi:MAG: hypothetical protein HQK96_20890 [Nitrospirae bacterium]|nr:hypothetical protein [Nitrospirota bacterium]
MALTMDDVWTILARDFGNYVSDGGVTPITFPFDNGYTPISGDVVFHTLVNDPDLQPGINANLRTRGKNPDIYDCDDYAITAKAKISSKGFADSNNVISLDSPYCVGVIVTINHIVNFSIDAAGNVWIIDFLYGVFYNFTQQGNQSAAWLYGGSVKLIFV